MTSLVEIQAEMIRLSRLLDAGITELYNSSTTYAQAENTYRMAKAKAYLEAEGTVAERQALADLATSTERVVHRIADGMRKALTEAVRSRRQQISALQSLTAAHRAEAEYTRTRPDGGI